MTASAVPITLLGGLSSALREQAAVAAVRERPGSCAVLYDVDAALGGLVLVRRVLDARGQHDVEPVELVGCCLACTVRADLGAAVDLVVGSGRWDTVLVAVPTAVTPGSVAVGLQAHSAARLDTVAVVVDAVLLLSQLQGDDLLADRGAQAAPTDRRSTADLLVGHLEDADVLLVAGLHRLGTGDAEHVHALLSHLAPLAVQLPVAADGSGAADLLATGRSSGPARADGVAGVRAGPADRERLAVLAAALCPPSCGVTTVVWSSDRPLHPVRLADALVPLLSGVVRSRGWISLAGRPGQQVRWESAGDGLRFGDPVGTSGPPRCDLVLTGSGISDQALRAALDDCLADDDDHPRPGDDPFLEALGPAGPAAASGPSHP